MKHSESLPKHIGLIPDGVRRWANKNSKSYFDAYVIGIQKVHRMMTIYLEQGINIGSIYMLSSDNLKRSKDCLDPVLELEEAFLRIELPKLATEWQVKISYVGNLSYVPESYKEAVLNVCELSKDFDKRKLYMLIGYDPKEEIAQASSKITHVDSVISHLWVPEYVDLVIRTSGELRISNFLPIQSGYAEFIFEKKFINDIDDNDIYGYLEEYIKRQKRLGK
jgi:undecaprenyl diphosphate synthase